MHISDVPDSRTVVMVCITAAERGVDKLCYGVNVLFVVFYSLHKCHVFAEAVGQKRKYSLIQT